VKYYGTTFDDTTHTTFLVMEYLPNGSLFDYLFVWKKALTINQTMEIALGIANGIEVLHKNDYVHCELASTHILLSSNLTAKLCDFGYTEYDSVHFFSQYNAVRNMAYAAPESVTGIHTANTKKKDIFSFGLILWELFALCTPLCYAQSFYPDLSSISFVHCIAKGARPRIPDGIPSVIRRLIAWAWHQEPDKRPSINQVQQVLAGVPPELVFTIKDSELEFGKDPMEINMFDFKVF